MRVIFTVLRIKCNICNICSIRQRQPNNKIPEIYINAVAVNTNACIYNSKPYFSRTRIIIMRSDREKPFRMSESAYIPNFSVE